MLRDLVNISVNSENKQDVLFGLNLARLHGVKIKSFDALLTHADAGVRLNAISYLDDSGNQSEYLPQLKLQLSTETEVSVRLGILQLLIQEADPGSYEIAERHINMETPEDQAGGAILLAELGHNADWVTAKVQQLCFSGSVRDRLAISRALGYARSEGFFHLLGMLLGDAEPEVRLTAIRSVKRCRAGILAPQLINLLSRRQTRFAATDALNSLGQPARKALIKSVSKQKYNRVKTALRVLSFHEHNDVQKTLIKLADINSLSFVCASEAIRYARRFPDYQLLAEGAGRQVTQTLQRLRSLNSIRQRERRKHALAELNVRIAQLRSQLVKWVVIASQHPQLVDLIGPLLSDRKPLEQAMTYELVESLVDDQDLLEALIYLESESTNEEPIKKNEDQWLEQVLAFDRKQEYVMDTMQIVVRLRQCDIFSQLQGEALFSIAELAHFREIKAGEYLYQKGDEPDGLYVVASGDVFTSRQISDCIGDLELLDGAPRVDDAVAKSDSVLVCISRQAFEDIIDEIPEVLRRLTERVVYSLRAAL